MVRTRLAASPTGYPHIGTIYQALFNYAYTAKNGGKFLVRIEDTDRKRFVEGSEDIIFQSLDWVGLSEDESPRKGGEYEPYRQSERLKIYHKYAQDLLEKGNAYYSYFPKQDAGQKKLYTGQSGKVASFETREKPPASIKEMTERGDWVIRLRVPRDEKISFKDEIRGEITFDTSEITEQVLVKSDGFPTYHLAVVVDDHLMEISHILRAEEWLSSTPKHILLYNYFNWDIPPIYHTAILRNPDKSKLSKRHGHTNVLWFKEQGFLPETILNFLALLGWSHPEEKEIFSLSEFIQLFELKDIRPVAPIFDLQKLSWMNGEYIRSMDIDELVQRIQGFYTNKKEDLSNLDDQVLKKLAILSQSRMNTLNEFYPLIKYFFEAPVPSDREFDPKITVMLREKLENLTAWNKDEIFSVFKSIMNTYNIKMPVLYNILTGEKRGLPLPDAIEVLGKEKTLKNLNQTSKT